MAARFPLIANSSANQIQELASGDDMNLTGSSITGAGIITATKLAGNEITAVGGVDATGGLKAAGIVSFTNATDSTSSTTGAVVISGGVGIAKSLFVGNNVTDGPFVSLSFTPRWIMLKATNTTNPFIIFDTARNPTNPVTKYLLASSNAVEAAAGRDIDFIADGIKLREDDSDMNGPYTYAYVAMADIGGNGTLPPIYGR